MVPSASSEPAEENATASGALPDGGVPDAAAVGGWLGTGLTTMFTDEVSVAPSSSVTVRVAVKVPSAMYVWVTSAELDAGVPSPKLHDWEAIEPSGSTEDPELKSTSSGTVPLW